MSGAGKAVRWAAALEASGLALGLICGARALAGQHYVALGFLRTAVLLVRAKAASGVAAGAIAAALLIAADLLRRGRASDTTAVSIAADAGRRRRAYLAVLAAGTVLAVAADLRRGYVPAAIPVATLSVFAFLAAAAAAARRIERPDPRRGFRVVLAAILGLGSVALLAAWFLATPSAHDRLRLEGTAGKAAVLLAGALLTGCWWRFVLPRAPGRRASLVLAILPPLILAAAFAVTPAPAPVANPKNVILIGIDTLRWDRTTLLRPDAEGRWLTPSLRALAQKGVVFDRAYSASCWTMPSFASILTGVYPQQHGATELFGALPHGATTLAEVLKEAGYRTGAVVSHLYVNADHGFAQGFDEFDDRNDLGPDAVTSPSVTDLAARFVDRHEGDRFFLFVHYFDPHYQYVPHDEFPFGASYAGWLSRRGMNFDELEHWRHHLEPGDLRYLEDLYDGEVAYTDREIGRLVDHLASRGRLEDTAIVVVADHGEEFLEHGTLGHSTALHEEIVHVPLFVVLPGVSPPRPMTDEVVETRTVFPTILSYLGVHPKGVPAGDGLLPAFRGLPVGTGEALSSVDVTDAPRSTGKRVTAVSMRTPAWSSIVDVGLGRASLYKLDDDRGETRDVSGEERERAAAMASRLAEWWRSTRHDAVGRNRGESEDDLRDRLRSLGYL